MELYSAEIIHKTNRDEVTLTTLTTEQKNIKLLAAVQSHLLVNPSSFEVFLSALKKQKPLASLVLCERMEEAYCKYYYIYIRLKCMSNSLLGVNFFQYLQPPILQVSGVKFTTNLCACLSVC